MTVGIEQQNYVARLPIGWNARNAAQRIRIRAPQLMQQFI